MVESKTYSDWLASIATFDLRDVAAHTAGQLAKSKARLKRNRRHSKFMRRWWQAKRERERKPVPKRLTRNPDSVLTWPLRFVGAMEAGEWYAQPDIIAAGGFPQGKWFHIMQRITRRGWVEQVPNPDYRPRYFRKGIMMDLQHNMKVRPIKWLYRLTEEGQRMKALAHLLA